MEEHSTFLDMRDSASTFGVDGRHTQDTFGILRAHSLCNSPSEPSTHKYDIYRGENNAFSRSQRTDASIPGAAATPNKDDMTATTLRP